MSVTLKDFFFIHDDGTNNIHCTMNLRVVLTRCHDRKYGFTRLIGTEHLLLPLFLHVAHVIM